MFITCASAIKDDPRLQTNALNIIVNSEVFYYIKKELLDKKNLTIFSFVDIIKYRTYSVPRVMKDIFFLKDSVC